MAQQNATCHSDRRHHAKGLCYPCYLRDWHERHPDRRPAYGRKYRTQHPNAGRLYYLANVVRTAAREKARREADPDINRRRVAAKHGLTLVERDDLLSNPCEICGGVATDVDHDHETGHIRGALCGPCNTGIGRLRDDPELVARAAEYLAAHQPLLKIV